MNTNHEATEVSQTVPLLSVSDIAESCSFYCDGLGFEMTREWRTDGELAWCWLEQGGASLMLEQACSDDPVTPTCGAGVTFYFICEDAAALHERITQRGIRATDPTVAFYGMNQTFVSDPDGYKLCFENPT